MSMASMVKTISQMRFFFPGDSMLCQVPAPEGRGEERRGKREGVGKEEGRSAGKRMTEEEHGRGENSDI